MLITIETFDTRSSRSSLIFCRDDSCAEDAVHICREVFGKGNDFHKTIPYQ
jgi:type I restriction enzyme R subunit